MDLKICQTSFISYHVCLYGLDDVVTFGRYPQALKTERTVVAFDKGTNDVAPFSHGVLEQCQHALYEREKERERKREREKERDRQTDR